MKLAGVWMFLIPVVFVVAVNAQAAPLDDQKTVAGLDTQYQAAVKVNDAAVMDRILADDFILVLGDGSTSTKADLLNEARSKRVIYEHQDETEQTVRVWGDTAVVTAKLWGKGIDSGKPFDWTLWFSDTYVRTPKGWRYVFEMASLPLPKKAAVQSRLNGIVQVPANSFGCQNVRSIDVLALLRGTNTGFRQQLRESILVCRITPKSHLL